MNFKNSSLFLKSDTDLLKIVNEGYIPMNFVRLFMDLTDSLRQKAKRTNWLFGVKDEIIGYLDFCIQI